MPNTQDNNNRHGPVYHHQQLAALQQLLTFCSLKLSYWPATAVLTLFKGTLSHIILVYFQPPARLPILTFHPTRVLFHLVWTTFVEPYRYEV